ncbi:LexA family protein [Pseudomonas coronafaciens]|uniref:LexA family protein n=1 Tax=Pseudomonas coronafaciens TaxID=53409 RepID=UPI0006D633BB|nr:S24 family peptidase [Pseudomonas coronafaciens]
MNVKILGRLCRSGQVIPCYTFKIPAGFPNPAADHIEQDFSFDRLMNLRAPHIYVAKIDGDSMEGAKIFHDSLVVVDRSRTPSSGSIVIVVLNNEPLCKILILQGDHVLLKSANPSYPPLHILEGEELSIWGVVRHGVTCFE